MAKRLFTKPLEEVAPKVVDGRIPPFKGNILDLPVRFQTIYKKRKQENLTGNAHLNLPQLPEREAEAEARLYVAKQMYKELARREEKKKQMPLFQIKGKTSMTPEAA